jgi:hypothetical protein
VSEADHSHKEPARLFLHRFEELLKGKLPAPREMREHIRGIATSKSQKHTNSVEAAFIHEYVVSNLFQLIREDGCDELNASKALLCEGYRNIPTRSSGTPMHPLSHPFDKEIAPASEILRKWKKGKLTQACPDIAIRHPFKIVFEVKYFEKGGSDFAARELVKYIYQAFFYRALPYVPPTKTTQAWGFDFSCLLACDVSDHGTLKAAWDDFSDRVQDGFWIGANVYVMILRRGDH